MNWHLPANKKKQKSFENIVATHCFHKYEITLNNWLLMKKIENTKLAIEDVRREHQLAIANREREHQQVIEEKR